MSESTYLTSGVVVLRIQAQSPTEAEAKMYDLLQRTFNGAYDIINVGALVLPEADAAANSYNLKPAE